nr:YhfC family glutamic-type intramembrane protease [Spelaeicoccus albus]
MIGLPVAASLVVCRRWRVPAGIPFIAAGFFLAQLILNSFLTKWLLPGALGHGEVMILLSALIYGVFEETARYFSFRVGPLRRRRDMGGALAAGIGHGGMESITMAVPYLLGAVMMTVSPGAYPPAAVAAFRHANPLLFIGTGADRIPAMLCHIIFAVMVVLAYRRGRKWIVAAIAAHAAVDALMFTLTAYAPATVWIGLWTLIALAALALIIRLVRSGTLGGDVDAEPRLARTTLRTRPVVQ